MSDRVEERHPLPDGSECVVEPIDHRSSLISREVNGGCVWGQAFSSDDHPAQIARVLADMTESPTNFYRWWNGKPEEMAISGPVAEYEADDVG